MPNTTIERGTVQRGSPDAGRLAWGRMKAIDRANRTATGVASTIELDRHGEVVLPSAFQKDLGRFLGSSAPFLAAHSHESASGSPTQIGWVMSGVLSADGLTCVFRYSDTPAAEQWWKLASDPSGKGHAFSIGFMPIAWASGQVKDLVREMPELAAPFGRAGLADDDRVRVWTEIELLEISAVPVPANRESLLVMAKLFAGGAGDSDIIPLAEAMEAAIDRAIAQTFGKRTEALQQLIVEHFDNLEETLGRVLTRMSDMVEAMTFAVPDVNDAPPADTPESDRDMGLRDPAGGQENGHVAAAEHLLAALD